MYNVANVVYNVLCVYNDPRVYNNVLPATCSAGTCHDDEFRCTDVGGCVPTKWKCDNHRDCDDGSDEKDCRKLTTSYDNNITNTIYIHLLLNVSI